MRRPLVDLTSVMKKAGFKKATAHTGAVTLIQRFGSALNLNLHFHALFIDGVYQQKDNGKLRFHRVNAPTPNELNTVVATISQRIARHLERQGLLARDDESSYLTLDLQDDDAMNQLQEIELHVLSFRRGLDHVIETEEDEADRWPEPSDQRSRGKRG